MLRPENLSTIFSTNFNFFSRPQNPGQRPHPEQLPSSLSPVYPDPGSDIFPIPFTPARTVNSNPLILVVDDEPLNIKLLDVVLKKNGFQTIAGTSGPAARALALEHQPDLILLDVMMPGEDGYTTCEQLKQHPQIADIPVIFISALTDTDSKVRGLEVGGVDYISKPFEKAEVLARVKVHLKLRFTYKALIEAQAQRLAQVQDAQQSLLVQPQDLPQAGFAVHYEPILEAGGDFYDVLPVGGAAFDYIVADVSGHDLRTSYVTSALKALFSQNCNPVTSPAESLGVINSVLCRILEDGTHITAGVAHLNRSQNTLTYVNAGHPPPILLRASGEIVIPRASGDILGVFESVWFETLTIPVTPGDRLFLYTDGLIEGFGPTKITREKGLAQLEAACSSLGRLPLSEAVDAICASLTQAAHEDDIILMAIEV
ncbi:MAG: fused response regulator/phosphatase [Deltaproteobacteria bacterium]|nr:fused response regulator/phosphatase [Deltaproteobacteria bacterium]